MPSTGNKRKLQKSGEKVSPEDKKQKNICQLDQMAEVKSNLSEDLGLLDKSKDLKWDKLMSKIDDISKQTEDIKDIKKVVAEVKADILAFKEKTSDIEKALNIYIEKTETIEKKVKELEKTQDLIGLLENELKATECENKRLKEQILMQESYSRRNNLIFDGITEQQQENTLLVLKHFLTSTLRFSTQECNSLLIASCHRIGRFQKGKNRPIIAKFVLDTERNKVWMQKSLLKNTSYVLREDYPSEIENRRKLMYPLFLEAKQKDQKSRLNGDKVVYMGKSYGYAQAP